MTVPGPETLVHVVASVLPNGKPSSVAVPFRVAAFGRRMVWSLPRINNGRLVLRMDSDDYIVTDGELRIVRR